MSKPSTIHGLPVISYDEARERGFQSITTDINSATEKPILAGVCQHRDPSRACLIHQGGTVYQLAILKQDVSDLGDSMVGGLQS